MCINNKTIDDKSGRKLSFLDQMARDYAELTEAGAEKISIGKTLLGREIFAFAVGCGAPKIIVQYAIHAREHITYFLAIEQIKTALRVLGHGRGTIYFVPVVNIDGVALAIDGIDTVPKNQQKILKKLVENNDFALFKANAQGVDLNVNFDARWGEGAKNVRFPNSENYIGTHPASEPEVQALVNFTLKIKPDFTISYHAKGEVIYYDFGQPRKIKKNHKKIAKIASEATGYPIRPSGKSAGGYKDWCISRLGIPAITIEVGAESWAHPINREFLAAIYQKNSKVIIKILDYLRAILYNKD